MSFAFECSASSLWKLVPCDRAASGSFSTAAAISNPAAWKPSDNPPHPANRSRTLGFPPAQSRASFCSMVRLIDLLVPVFPRAPRTEAPFGARDCPGISAQPVGSPKLSRHRWPQPFVEPGRTLPPAAPPRSVPVWGIVSPWFLNRRYEEVTKYMPIWCIIHHPLRLGRSDSGQPHPPAA